MLTLIERLQLEIERLEALHGPSDPFVHDLKKQLHGYLESQDLRHQLGDGAAPKECDAVATKTRTDSTELMRAKGRR